MAAAKHLPVYKVAYDLFGVITGAVRNIPRDLKQIVGSRLANEAMTIVMLIFRANSAARSENSLGTHPLAWEVAQREFFAHGLPIPPKTRLRPEWVEWLQGFPSGWTDLEPLEMRKFQEWQQQHGTYSADKDAA